ncbi:MAG: efflux RND transporter periplasmic adaptor subunit [Bacteroidales bacterium]
MIREAGEMKLSFRVAGPVPRVYVREGEYVKQGQVIAEMDPRDYELQKAAVEAQVEQLRSEYGRIEELWKRSSVAENDYEKMKAGVEMAESKLRNASDQLQDTRLLAPFSGYIARVHIREGDVVNYGTPLQVSSISAA